MYHSTLGSRVIKRKVPVELVEIFFAPGGAVGVGPALLSPLVAIRVPAIIADQLQATVEQIWKK